MPSLCYICHLNNLNKPIKIMDIRYYFFYSNLSAKLLMKFKVERIFLLIPVIIASKHQSAFETFALFYYLPKSIFIHKKQLFLIPIFGQYLKKLNMISIDRKGGGSTIRKMLRTN